MADLTITAANVGLTDGSSQIGKDLAGETLTQGQVIYKVASTGKMIGCDADDLTASQATGIVLTPALLNEYVVYAKSGDIDLGVTLAVGETYIVSSTKAGIADIGDAIAGMYITFLGVATAADTLHLDIVASKVLKA